MKITVEINDVTLENAIGQQLQKAVAERIGQQLETVVNDVLIKKLARFDDEVISNRIAQAARRMLRESLGKSDWQQDGALRQAIDRAAVALIREQMK